MAFSTLKEYITLAQIKQAKMPQPAT